MPQPTAVVNLRLDASRETIQINWTQAPGAAPRQIDAAKIARLNELTQRVGEAEQSESDDANPIPAARLAMGRALYDILDGPERALSQRLKQTQATGVSCALVVRLQADNPEHLSDHLAAHWRWELLADEQGHVGLQRHISIAV